MPFTLQIFLSISIKTKKAHRNPMCLSNDQIITSRFMIDSFAPNTSLKSLVIARLSLRFLPCLGTKYSYQNTKLIFRSLLTK